MARSMSKRMIVGNIGKIYDKRTVGERQQSVLEFSVASTDRFRDSDGEWKDAPTEWTTVKAWGQLADNIKDAWNSGDRVFVYGRVEMKNPYTDKEGVEHPARPVLVAEVAGHEDSKDPSIQQRTKREGGYQGNNNSSNAPAKKPAPAKKDAPAPAPAALDDDDNLDDLLGALDDDDSDDMPF